MSIHVSEQFLRTNDDNIYKRNYNPNLLFSMHIKKNKKNRQITSVVLNVSVHKKSILSQEICFNNL